MNKKRFFYVLALMCIVNLNYSCDKETAAEVEDIISLDKDELNEEDDS